MIRKVTPHDFPLVLDFYKKGLEELGEEWVESRLVNKIVTSHKLVPSFLYEDKGFAGFTAGTLSHNGKPIMSEYMFYVLPKYRNMKTLSALVNAGKSFATENGMALRLELFVLDDIKLKERLLKMNGFKVTGLIGVHNG